MVNVSLKEKLQRDQCVLGAFVPMRSSEVIEILGTAGFDFLILDCEHGSMSPSEIPCLVHAAENVNIPVVVRLGGLVPNSENVLKVLDSGAIGVQVPHVDNGSIAKDCVSYVKYPPVGKRGYAASARAAYLNKKKGLAYIDWANRETVVVAQIESVEALDNLGEILRVEQIDVFFIGPTDLALTLGEDNPHGPNVLNTIERAIQQIRSAGRIVGIFAQTPQDVRYWYGLGVRYIATSAVGIFSSASKGFVSDSLGNMKG
ncbi:HpcH/HpaI aldolase family protein [Alicyclobacillus dauci]|uniref:Aldolase/citrate lyase family protein n=1 Tax=Alicyclobacillus dauci TaxID=1475485 RepID=A0ABY6YZY4_9BACL|nr:aldolase/citrate lyase family protein [Alicyclobacillus dauci]WAH36192.1 aldolase/citrate lyase family protein [Alicyclobacillus dauci]